jgi:2-polyprenyl-3-methyl-5-hydroxy-6-metoxy-1,4-benzoquinol methylase
MTDNSGLIYKNKGNTGLLRLLSAAASPGKVLDCGCGAGDNARLLRSNGWRVTAITIDPREQEAAQPFCDAVHLTNLEEGLPTSVGGGFDVILASHVLEHLARPERLLRDVPPRLKTGGVLAVALPNIAHYRQRIRFVQGKFNYTEAGQLDRTHLRFYTYKTAAQLLERNGYELIHVIAEGGLPWWKSRSLVPLELVSRLDEWATRLRPNLFAEQSLLLAKPLCR